MNLSCKARIVVVICISWLLYSYLAIGPFGHSGGDGFRDRNNENVVRAGVFPVVIILGTMWIWRGKKDSDQDKDNTNHS